MALAGIGTYSGNSGLDMYGSINNNDSSVRLKNQEIYEQQATVQVETQQDAQKSTGSLDASNMNNAPKSSNPSDFTFDFKKNNDFNLVGATSSLEDLDVEKAMSDMKKDSVLDQYKFFVNPVNLGTDGDGSVRMVRR